MKQRVLVGALIAVLGVVASCGGSGGDGSVPTMPDVVGKRLDVAQSDVKRAGIDGETEVLGGGTFGVVDESNWTVCEQLPAPGSAVDTTLRLTIDRTCPDDTGASTETTEVPATSSALPSTTQPIAQETLTVENSPELAALLSGPDSCGDAETFAAKYLGRTIEFDGNIAYEAPSGGGLDFLVHSGDYSEVTAPGPAMKFAIGSSPESKLVGGDGVIRQRDNLRIVAVVDSYNEGGCLLYLDPVSLRDR